MNTRKDKRIFNFEFIQNYPFWTYVKIKSAHTFFGAWSFLLIHVWFTPSERPKSFVNWF